MTNAQIYRQAAWRIENHNQVFSCVAIKDIEREIYRGSWRDLDEKYRKVFCPGKSHFERKEGNFTVKIDRFCQRIEKSSRKSARCRDLRVLLLCMMAACWRDFV